MQGSAVNAIIGHPYLCSGLKGRFHLSLRLTGAVGCLAEYGICGRVLLDLQHTHYS